jgi:hypothetical protein
VRQTRRAISVRFLLVTIGAIFVADAFVVALLVKPPPIGWIGLRSSPRSFSVWPR